LQSDIRSCFHPSNSIASTLKPSAQSKLAIVFSRTRLGAPDIRRSTRGGGCSNGRFYFDERTYSTWTGGKKVGRGSTIQGLTTESKEVG
jgi:hypothetical protein